MMLFCADDPFKPSETFIRRQLEAFREITEVTLLSGSWRPSFWNEHSIFGNLPLTLRLTNRLSKLPGSLLRPLGWESALAYRLDQKRPTVALCQYGLMGAEVGPVLQRCGIRYFVHFHGFDAFRRELLKTRSESYTRMFVGAEGLIAVSSEMVAQLVSLGAPATKIHLIPCGVNGVDREEALVIRKPAGTQILSVGRFVEKKAPMLTLLAFQKVYRENSAARLTMIGDGPLYGSCVRLANGLGIGHVVEFRGFQGHDEVIGQMDRSNVLVQHSVVADDGDREGTPVSIMEAMSRGLPVVATRHAGIRELVVEGVTGLLVDEGDIDGYARAIASLLRNPEEARELGEHGRARVRQCYAFNTQFSTLARVIGLSR